MFGEETWLLPQVLRKVLLYAMYWRGGLGLERTDLVAGSNTSTGTRMGHYLVVDGSYNSATGAVAMLTSSDRGWCTTISESKEFGTACKSELWAVELGFTHVWNVGIQSLFCASDCVDVIRVLGAQVNIDTFWERDQIIYGGKGLVEEGPLCLFYTCAP